MKKQVKNLLFTFIFMSVATIFAMEQQESVLPQELPVWIETNDKQVICFKPYHVAYLGTLKSEFYTGYSSSKNNPIGLNISQQSGKTIKELLDLIKPKAHDSEEEKVLAVADYLSKNKSTITTELKNVITFLDCPILINAFAALNTTQAMDVSQDLPSRKRKLQDDAIAITTNDGEKIYIPKDVGHASKKLKQADDYNDMNEEDNELFLPTISAPTLEKITELLIFMKDTRTTLLASSDVEQKKAVADLEKERIEELAKLQPLSAEELADMALFEKLKNKVGLLLTDEEFENILIEEREIHERKWLASLSEKEKSEERKKIEEKYAQRKAVTIIDHEKLTYALTEEAKKFIREKNLPLQELLSLAQSADFLDCPEIFPTLLQLAHESLTQEYKQGTCNLEHVPFDATTEVLMKEKITTQLASCYVKEPVAIKVAPNKEQIYAIKDISAIFDTVIVTDFYKPTMHDITTQQTIPLQMVTNLANKYTNFKCAPDKKTIAALTALGTLFVLWNMETGKIITTIPLDLGRFISFNYADNDTITMVCKEENHYENAPYYRIYDYSIAQQKSSLLHTFAVKKFPIHSTTVLWSPSGAGLISITDANSSGTLFYHFNTEVIYPKIFNAYASLYTYAHPYLVLYNDENKTFELWDVRTSEIVETIENTLGYVLKLALSSDGKTIAFIIATETNNNFKMALFDRSQKTFALFDISDDFEKYQWLSLKELYFSSDNKNILVSYEKSFEIFSASLWHIETGKRIHSFDNYKISKIAPDGSIMVVQATLIHEAYVENSDNYSCWHPFHFMITIDYIGDRKPIHDALKELSVEQALFLQSLSLESSTPLTQQEYEVYATIPEVLKNLIKTHVLLF